MKSSHKIKIIISLLSVFAACNSFALSPNDCKEIIVDIHSEVGKKQWSDCLTSDNFDLNKYLKNQAETIGSFNDKFQSDKTEIEKEIKNSLNVFSTLGFNLGSDYLPILKEKITFTDAGADVDGFPGVRKESSDVNTSLYFYRNILFMIISKELQDTMEIRAAMDQIESKFKSKFVKLKPTTTKSGNIESIENVFSMNIGSYGLAKVELSTTNTINKKVCLDDIAREMRSNIRMGYKNYTSLEDRFDLECKLRSNPTRIVFINKQIESIVNLRANEEERAKRKKEEIEKNNSAIEKAKKF